MPDEYETLWSVLKRDEALHDYVHDKLKFDWSLLTYSLTIRMSIPIHNVFTEHVKNEIRSQLKRVGEKDGQVRAIINMIGVTTPR